MALRDLSLDRSSSAVTEVSPPEQPQPSRAAQRRDPYPLAEAALAVGSFTLIGASIGLFVGTLANLPVTLLGPFLEENSLDPEVRTRLAWWLAAGAASFLVVTLVYVAARRRRGVSALRRASEVLFPFSLLFLLPSLFVAVPWSYQPLTYLIGLTVTVLLLERLLLRSQRAWPTAALQYWQAKIRLSPRVQKWLPLGVVVAGSIFYAVYFSHYTILNHQRFNTASYDLGINVNWCYNALHGHPERSTVLFGPNGGHFLGNHAIFAMAFWLPIYAIKPGAEVLLIVQATLAGSAAITLYLFASTQLPRWSAVVVAFAYLFFAPLHGPNFYDFHELLPPLPVHFLLYWAIARQKNWLVLLLVPVLWSFREDVAVGLTVLGVFLLITGTRPRMGLAIAAASGLWFVLIKFAIMPRYWQTWFASIYKELQAPGARGYGTVVQTILINPMYFLTTMLKEEKLIYFLHFFGPLALLPARRAAFLLLAIPGFAFSLLTTGYAPTLSIAFQYTCHSIPYVFAATVLMLRILGQRDDGNFRRRAAIGAVALGVLSHSYVFGAILQHNTFVGGFSKVEFSITQDERDRFEMVKRMAQAIPQEASVTGTDHELVHVAARLDAYTLSNVSAPADYVLVRGAVARSGTSNRHLRQMFEEDSYGLIMQGEDLYLFKRGHVSDETKAALKSLHLPATPR